MVSNWGAVLDDSRDVLGAVGRSRVLFLPVLDEMIGEPEDDIGTIVEVCRRSGHLLSAGSALCRHRSQLMVVANCEFRNHLGVDQTQAHGDEADGRYVALSIRGGGLKRTGGPHPLLRHCGPSWVRVQGLLD
jgi:hypothetical protein